MQTYANALLIAIPSFLLLILIEGIVGHFKGKKALKSLDTISSLSSGITNVVKDSLGLIVIIVSYPVLLEALALFEMEANIWAYLVGFIAIDFAGYWTHRLSHSVNIFWNKHAIHHSSEEFNLPCALRQSVSNLVGLYSFFLIPAAFLGVPAIVVAILAPIHLFLQFWYHTTLIPKLGWLEYILVTPSQHRVHHAINPEYLDKNLGQIFTWWDRIFGTFQEEMDEVPPVYGITRPMSTWNPIKINFKHIWLLTLDAWRTRSWWDKLRIWFMPLGWRPADVAEKYPVQKIEDVYNFEKYRTPLSSALTSWSWYQLVFSTLLLLYMFWQFSDIGFPALFIYGGLIFLGIYGYTSLMDLDKSSVWVEVFRSLLGLGWIVYSGDWFGINEIAPLLTPIIACYYISTGVGAIYFYVREVKNYAKPQIISA